jgi:hypothetical protein
VDAHVRREDHTDHVYATQGTPTCAGQLGAICGLAVAGANTTKRRASPLTPNKSYGALCGIDIVCVSAGTSTRQAIPRAAARRTFECFVWYGPAPS